MLTAALQSCALACAAPCQYVRYDQSAKLLHQLVFRSVCRLSEDRDKNAADVVNLLLDAGADALALDGDGHTPLDLIPGADNTCTAGSACPLTCAALQAAMQ